MLFFTKRQTMTYYYPLSISNTQNNSPSWLDVPHPITSHMSYVIPLFRNLYCVMKCKCYCVVDTFSFYEANLNMASQKITLYHYRSSDGAKTIESSKMIEVSINNYRYPNTKRKLEYCIIVTMPKNKVSLCSAGQRQVFLHEGDVNVADRAYTYAIKKCKFMESQSNTTMNALKLFAQRGAVAVSSFTSQKFSAQGDAATMSNFISNIGVTASSCDLHVWLLLF